MNVNERITLQLSEEEVKEIVMEYAKGKGYNPVSVTITKTQVCKGFGIGEHMETELGVSINCTK